MGTEPEGTAPRLGHLTARNLGEGLALLMTRADISRKDVAEKAGISPGALWGWEVNRTRSPDMAKFRSVIKLLTDRTGDDFEATFTEFARLIDEGREKAP